MATRARNARNPSHPQHPGSYIRDEVLTPKKLSVLAAARLVGVGRPALSNFVNGHVAATPDMATRLEVAFGVPAQQLLDMQAAYDAAQAKAKGAPGNVIPYVVPLLALKAVDVEGWVTRNIPARSRLAVFLRVLVNSTGRDLVKVDFPGNDDAERSGWDGCIEARQPTPWIPEGRSGWEFGTNLDIKDKADSDFAKSVKALPKTERSEITFVFVTPRHWPGKTDWIKQNKAKKQWKDVRAYDSSDLEQWLEQSVAGQVWFANETARPSHEVRGLDKCWADWANVAAPALHSSLFTPAVEAAKKPILSRLSQPAAEPTVVAADSAEEALAFLAQLFGPGGGEQLAQSRDRVLIFDQPGVLPKVAQGSKDFIAVTANRDVERELGSIATSIHTIVVCPRNTPNATPHIVLEPVNYDVFRTALEKMGCGSDDIARYSKESGRSLTVLRRRLATMPAIKTPEWAANHEIRTNLIPFLFVGTWNSRNAADQAALELLANGSYPEIEKNAQRFASLNDAPLWSVGTYRGLVSKIDVLFAVAGSVTEHDIRQYLELAKMILGEDDPKLDLPESERWFAAIRGKSREFSAALREGISETLVLLAVHGNHLFGTRLGFNCEAASARLVKELLTPVKTRVLEANDGELTAYAEAAPEEFLSILEDDLTSDHPETYGLMRPTSSEIFSACPRAGLLWALEGLAWNPATFLRSALILAQLSQIEINDNWGNKPIGSLESIFRSWMPQTAADHETRVRVLKLLAAKYPQVAWKICVAQIDTAARVGHYSHKPKWRNDGYGFGEPFKTTGPIHAFLREVVGLVLGWPSGHTRQMLGDLIQDLHGLSPEHQEKVWELVRTFAKTASDTDKAVLREKVRVTVMSRRAQRRHKDDFANLTLSGKAAYNALEPSDLLSKHEWLFRNHWVEESADELSADDMDFQKRDERIAKLRKGVLGEIVAAQGLLGVLQLAEMGNAGSLIGRITAAELLDQDAIPDFLLTALSSTKTLSVARKNVVSGALHSLQDEGNRTRVLQTAKSRLSNDDFVTLLLLAPFRRASWLLVDGLEEVYRNRYWSEIVPEWIRGAADETNEAVERLIAAERPRAAFACVYLSLSDLAPKLLFRLMSEMLKDGKDAPGQYQLDEYYVEEAFKLLDKSSALTQEQKAGLELAYIDALSKPWSSRDHYGIPNLEKYIESHPELYTQAVVWSYRRGDKGEDPAELRVAPEHKGRFAERGHKLLDAVHRIPGQDEPEDERSAKLAEWIKKVRDACGELSRADIADQCIGQLLARAPIGKDGVWPSEPVRQVMEDVHSRHMMAGTHTGLYNSRGVIWRGEGGNQERELVAKYQAWADALQYTHPFVASQLLMDMVKTYSQEANREDTEAGIRRRLHS